MHMPSISAEKHASILHDLNPSRIYIPVPGRYAAGMTFTSLRIGVERV